MKSNLQFGPWSIKGWCAEEEIEIVIETSNKQETHEEESVFYRWPSNNMKWYLICVGMWKVTEGIIE